jgi:hypothetical protein
MLQCVREGRHRSDRLVKFLIRERWDFDHLETKPCVIKERRTHRF